MLKFMDSSEMILMFIFYVVLSSFPISRVPSLSFKDSCYKKVDDSRAKGVVSLVWLSDLV